MDDFQSPLQVAIHCVTCNDKDSELLVEIFSSIVICMLIIPVLQF